MHFSRESRRVGEAVAVAITFTEVTSRTLAMTILCHLRTSSTICSSGTSPEVEETCRGHSNPNDNSRGRIRGRAMEITKTWAFFSGRCFPCCFSSSWPFSLACSRVDSFRMVPTTITACSALTTTSSSLWVTDSARFTTFPCRPCVISATTRGWRCSWIKRWKRIRLGRLNANVTLRRRSANSSNHRASATLWRIGMTRARSIWLRWKPSICPSATRWRRIRRQ